MDQDFHYYGTYQAAILSGWKAENALLVAKAANFVDFLNEATYRGYWEIKDQNQIVGNFDAPRYTFQANLSGQGLSPSEGLWAAFHFLPGNYRDPQGTPSLDKTHYDWAKHLLPDHTLRDVKPKYQTYAQRLTRPMSAASRYLIEDTVLLSKNPKQAYEILLTAPAAYHILKDNPDQVVKRFNIILAGIRAHVIADTWAHQDWAGVSSDINTYWDNSDSWRTFIGNKNYSIKYLIGGDAWRTVVLRSGEKNLNLQGAPNFFGNLGHGWMGHLPDYSFVQYKYRPAWDADKKEYLRDNPKEFLYAFIELLNLFHKIKGNGGHFQENLNLVELVLRASMDFGILQMPVRKYSEQKWRQSFHDIPAIDAEKEPSPAAVLDGNVTKPTGVKGQTAYGTFTLDLKNNNNVCDLYLFQIAADYHFHFVRDWLHQNNIVTLNDSWSKDPAVLDSDIHVFIAKRLDAIKKNTEVQSIIGLW